jgi:Icc-related predicted phosphoesterase
MRIVCISDTHLQAVAVPEGDLLVHAGDFTMRGTLAEVALFNRWLGALPHPHKVVVAGNHDFAFERHKERARQALTGATYLEDEGIELGGLRIWGSPWQPRFGDWAFNLDRGADLRAKWESIPEGLDVLITHAPPAGIGDRTSAGDHVGCCDLRDVVQSRAPRLHVFGHIHEAYGILETPATLYVNAAVCTASYRAENPPIIVDLEPGRPPVPSF